MPMKRENGLRFFYQWEQNQQLVVETDCTIVHFGNGTTEKALSCEVFKEDGVRKVKVPNIFLQTAADLHAYAWNEKTTSVTEHAVFRVVARPKPEDYAYTETEVKRYDVLLQMLEEKGAYYTPAVDAEGNLSWEKSLEKMRDLPVVNIRGPKGKDGAIAFKIVNALPEVGDEGTIYLLPAEEGSENNLFDEYIYTDGKWEKIGSAAVAVDLSDYVKKTDIATDTTAGVVKVTPHFGVQLRDGDWLATACAGAAEIAAKANAMKPIVPCWLDNAIKAGMVNNKLEWTEEEKDSARALIGAVKQYIPERVEINRCYAYTQSAGQDKEQKMIPIDGYSVWNKFSVPTRNGNGTIYIPDSSIKDDGAIPTGQIAVNKNYVDGLVGDIESVFDELHAYAQALINGGAAE